MSAVDMIRACAIGQRKRTVMFVVAVAPIPESGHAGEVDFAQGFRCAVELDANDRIEMRAKLHDALNAIADMMTDRP